MFNELMTQHTSWLLKKGFCELLSDAPFASRTVSGVSGGIIVVVGTMFSPLERASAKLGHSAPLERRSAAE